VIKPRTLKERRVERCIKSLKVLISGLSLVQIWDKLTNIEHGVGLEAMHVNDTLH